MNSEKKILSIMEQNNGYIKTCDLVTHDINKMGLTRLVKKGIIERVAKGLYIDSNKFEDPYYIFQYICPKAIFSHECALYFHDLTDRTPSTLMATVPSGYYTRYLKNTNYSFSYIKQTLYQLGKTTISTPYGNTVYCYDIERTICDIVRNKNKIESYQFTDALKRYAKIDTKNIDKLYDYANKFKIKEEIKKYMELLI